MIGDCYSFKKLNICIILVSYDSVSLIWCTQKKKGLVHPKKKRFGATLVYMGVDTFLLYSFSYYMHGLSLNYSL